MGEFSFYPGKNLGALGDGGAIVTDNEILAKKLDHYENMAEQKIHHAYLGGLLLGLLQATFLLKN